ncbi:MAG: hypothetical protein OXU69_14885 [Gemmatimonadota bacterium]|nr:hypothetical protein [Gemmatimonadota bacterium]MDE2985986.1 hypothetical protein [Gemmatimonadota bacterium]
MEPWVVSTSLIFIYLLATVVIGILANRKGTSSMEDFFLYGQQTGIIVLYLTIVANIHSAFAFLASGGYFLTHGSGLNGRHMDGAGRGHHLNAGHADLGARQEVRLHRARGGQSRPTIGNGETPGREDAS